MPARRRTGRTSAPRPREPELADRLPLPDGQLIELLHDLHKRATLLHPDDAPAHEAAIAHMECELLARGVNLPAAIEEPMPHKVAFDLFRKALGSQDADAAARAIRNLPDGALWLACRRIRESYDARFRIHCLSQVLFRLDLCFLGHADATVRQESIARNNLDEPDLEAFLEQCIASMYSVLFSRGPYPGEAHDAR